MWADEVEEDEAEEDEGDQAWKPGEEASEDTDDSDNLQASSKPVNNLDGKAEPKKRGRPSTSSDPRNIRRRVGQPKNEVGRPRSAQRTTSQMYNDRSYRKNKEKWKSLKVVQSMQRDNPKAMQHLSTYFKAKQGQVDAQQLGVKTEDEQTVLDNVDCFFRIRLVEHLIKHD